jgi:hypothetical protein
MLKDEPSLAIVAVHTAENEPLKVWGDLFSSSVHSLNVTDKKKSIGTAHAVKVQRIVPPTELAKNSRVMPCA